MVKCTGYLPVKYAQNMNACTEGRCEYCAPARSNNLQKAFDIHVLSFNYVLMFLHSLCNCKPQLTTLVLKKTVQVIGGSTITAHC
jgi:hypothetical protein